MVLQLSIVGRKALEKEQVILEQMRELGLLCLFV
jgi:hypothetical protein